VARRLISSGGPWEARTGYSRAVVVGDEAFVSGTTDAGRDGVSRHPGDPRGQAEAVFEIISKALGEGGFGLADVVRTRMFVTDVAHVEPVATVLVEIEVDARRASAEASG
jgi:enamine deaminase RidA (YjgF/YER057c/UK114 family)